MNSQKKAVQKYSFKRSDNANIVRKVISSSQSTWLKLGWENSRPIKFLPVF